MMTKIEQALNYLEEIVMNGAEYPDAVGRVAAQFGVSQRALETAYDNAFVNNGKN